MATVTQKRSMSQLAVSVMLITCVIIVLKYGCVPVQATYYKNTITICSTKNSSENCHFNFTEALKLVNISLIQTLLLDPGEHILDTDHIIIGLTGISLVGLSSNFQDVIVKCHSNRNNGGAGLAFFDVANLTIANMTISGCGVKSTFKLVNTIITKTSSSVKAGLYLRSCRTVNLQNLEIRNTDGVGLLGINLHCNSVIQHVNFLNNGLSSSNPESGAGGGAYLIYQDALEHKNSTEEHSIEVTDCSFLANVDEEGGGGLKVIMSQTQYSIRLLIQSSTFCDNTANYGAGALIGITNEFNGLIFTSSRAEYTGSVIADIKLHDCNFYNNTAHKGSSALLVYKNSDCVSSMLDIASCEFLNNNALNNSLQAANESPTIGTTVSIQYISTSLSGKNYFFRNKGTALEVVSCPVHIRGYTEVLQNQGVRGGGLRILGSAHLVMSNMSALNFTHNTAFFTGGAIFVGHIPGGYPLEITKDHCFLYIEQLLQYFHFNTSLPGPKITFNNNQAIAGRAVYGSTLEGCEWAHDTLSVQTSGRNVYEVLLNVGIIVFCDLNNTTLIGTGIINTPVDKISVNNIENLHVMPGESFELQITTLDKFQQPVPCFLSALYSEAEIYMMIPETQVWYVNGTSRISLRVLGKPNQSVPITFFAVDENSCDFTTYTDVFIALISCIPGFHFSNLSNRCECINDLANWGVFCDPNIGSLLVPKDLWIGPVLDDDDSDSLFGSCQCLEEYCKGEDVKVTNNDFVFQCIGNLHRTGVGCGACEAGYSALLGSSQCQLCTNFSLFLIVLFAVIGPVTILGMFLLRITITEGYLNSVLFYSNIVDLFADYFTPQTNGKGAFTITAWISQNLGIPACFYNGMTTLDVFGLQYAYVTYLFLLVGCFGLIARYVQLPFVKKYAPSKVFATVCVICYTKLVETSVGIISYTELKVVGRSSIARWYYDPNITYFEGTHALLCVLAIFTLLLFVILFPMTILTSKCTYKIKYFNKLQPLYDAFWSPFKPKLQWWLSFRLLLRLAAALISSFVSTPYNIYSMAIILIILLFIQSHLSPFRGRWQNIVDDTFVLILSLIFSGYALFLFDKNLHLPNTVGLTVYCSLLTAIAYMLFIVVLVVHIYLRFPKLKLSLVNLPSYLKQPSRRSTRLLLLEDQESPPADTYSDVDISTKEREEDKLRLASSLNESRVEDSTLSSSHTQLIKTPTTAIRNETALGESSSKPDKSYLEHTEYFDFAEDRQPLLADQDNYL